MSFWEKDPDPPARHIKPSLARKAKIRKLLAPVVQDLWQRVCEIGMLTREHPRGRRFHQFGKGSFVSFPPGTIYGEHAICIGEDTMIGPWVSISAGMMPGQELLSDRVVAIGDRCMIGRGSHIVGHFGIEIGNDVITGPYVYITDQNHGYEDVEKPIWKQAPKDSGVHIGNGCWLGTNCVILPGTFIGDNVVVAASAVVSGEVPSYCVVAGAPAKIVKRYIEGEGWKKVPADT
ncbi:MAG: acyltransferase [Acidimicrobiales bacterium]|nr:acyltransferase [Acidimicrobiales bacterium]